MTVTSAAIYENHLKNGYVVQKGAASLVITDTSCYQAGEETAWLISGLPVNGTKERYFNSLSELGLAEPQKIFDRLIALGALREKEKRSWKDVLASVLTPRIKLLPAQAQEKFLRFFGVEPAMAVSKKTAGFFISLSVLGILWGMMLMIAGPEKTLPYPLAGRVNGIVVFALVLFGSLLHELGHSFASATAGIGLRPIGFSVYLVYPVFYTNVSGIEKLKLKKKAFIDCGGFIFQSAFLLLLLSFCALTGNMSCFEAARWISVIIVFNINPLLRTDGYWLYQDLRSDFKESRWMRRAHYLYLAAFIAFSAYFLWRIYGRIGTITQEIGILIHSPRYLLSGGYKIILGAYFILIAFAGGLRRLQEGHQEWVELRKNRAGMVFGH